MSDVVRFRSIYKNYGQLFLLHHRSIRFEIRKTWNHLILPSFWEETIDQIEITSLKEPSEMGKEILSMQRRSNIVNTSVPFVAWIILIIPFIYEGSLPNLSRRISSDSNKGNWTWTAWSIWKWKIEQTWYQTFIPHSFILSKVQQSELDALDSPAQRWPELMSNLLISARMGCTYSRPQTARARQLVPGHAFKQRNLVQQFQRERASRSLSLDSWQAIN